MNGRIMQRGVLAVALVLWVAVVVRVWNGVNTTQWDLKSYTSAVGVYENGQNPYDTEALRSFAGNRRILPFHYPLWTIHLFRPICELPYPTAHRLWLVLKLVFLAALTVLWKRVFLRETGWWLILPVTLLAFGGATLWDINAGNITVYEQVFLWTGFAFLVRGRVAPFVACIAVAGAFKILPGLFLLLVFLPAVRSRRSMVAALLGVLAIAALILAPFASRPEFFERYLRGIVRSHPRLEFNPSIGGMFDEVLFYQPALAGFAWLRYVVIAGWWVLVLTLSRGWMRRVLAARSLPPQILAATVVYALLAPRLVIYSYLVVIPAALALVAPALASTRAGGLAGLAAICAGGFAVMQSNLGHFMDHALPFLFLLGCWAVLIASTAEVPAAKRKAV